MKPWYQSKTIWGNLLFALLAALSLPELGKVLPESVLPYVGLIAGVLNIANRFLTDKPIQLPEDK